MALQDDRIEEPLIPRPRLQLTIRTEVAVDERLYR
jgi:hypothetical protein